MQRQTPARRNPGWPFFKGKEAVPARSSPPNGAGQQAATSAVTRVKAWGARAALPIMTNCNHTATSQTYGSD
jgi:hypothetical protein